MGRKIPSKKHRGVKDPLEQHARRMQSLKGKINAPPKDPDEQPVPRSLERLFAFQNKKSDKLTEKKKNQKKLIRDAATSNRGDNPVAKLRKLPGESGRSFSLRINSAIKTLNDPRGEVDFPDDNEMDSEDAKGERMAAQRERRQRKRKPASDEPHLTRTQKRALKEKLKKEKIAEQQPRPEVVYERVGFGEVTHAPPALSVKPRRVRADGSAARPGRRDLLLSSLLRGGAGAAGAGAGVSAAELQRRERARLEAVAAYRSLKKQNRERDKQARPPRRHNIAA